MRCGRTRPSDSQTNFLSQSLGIFRLSVPRGRMPLVRHTVTFSALVFFFSSFPLCFYSPSGPLVFLTDLRLIVCAKILHDLQVMRNVCVCFVCSDNHLPRPLSLCLCPSMCYFPDQTHTCTAAESNIHRCFTRNLHAIGIHENMIV